MKVVRLHITMQDYTEVERVIDVRSDQSFEHLHNAILDSVGFDKSQLASFFLCSDDWDKKLEITLIDMNEGSDLAPVMQETAIEKYVSAKGQKLIYEYDFVLMWRFLIEVEDIRDHKEELGYPKLVESIGVAPDQYETTERYPGEITDEDSDIIDELRRRNEDLFLSDDTDEDMDGWDDHDSIEGFGRDEEEDLY